MTMCWNCGTKIQGATHRTWVTTSYSQRAYSGLSLRSGRIYVGSSGGQRQSVVSLCKPCHAIYTTTLLDRLPQSVINVLAAIVGIASLAAGIGIAKAIFHGLLGS